MRSPFVLQFLVIFIMSIWFEQGFGQTFSFMHNSILRSYIVHLPTNYNPANSYPLVINMHGLTNTAAIQETYTGMNTVADTGNFVVIYPDATSSTSFNAGFNSPYNSGVDDVGFLNALLDTAIANYSIDTLRIYACGMSNGGFMSYRLACEMENRIAAIASVAGTMPDSMEYYCQNNRPVPVMQVHGTTDPTVNYYGAPGIWAVESTVDYWVQKNSCPMPAVNTSIANTSLIDLSTAETFYYGLCDGATEVLFYKVTGGGHTWPGAIPVPALGNTNQDFNASGEIWRFFRKYTLPVLPNPVSISDFLGTQKLEITPNPSSDIIVITGIDAGENFAVKIMSMMGQEIAMYHLESNTIELDISALSRGIYLVQLLNEQNRFTGKLIKN